MESNNWNQVVSQMPSPHFLQTYEWAQVKAKYGWIPYYMIWGSAGEWKIGSKPINDPQIRTVAAALVLKRQVTRGGFAAKLSVLYCPKGPLMDWTNDALRKRVFADLESFARKQGAIFLKMDPDIVLGRGIPFSEGDVRDLTGQSIMEEMKRRGWGYSSEQIQFQNTVLVSLKETEDEMLARMKPKTRYNVRLAYKKGVGLRVGNSGDLPVLYRMYAETSTRDGFVIRDENYYMTVWNTFMQNKNPTAVPLIAEVDGEPVAGLFLFMFGKRAYYVYGMSRAAHREKMPTYFLQWEAMKYAKSKGCEEYDLWGAPEVFDESDSMWGVFRFKEGLGGEVVRTVGAYDFVPNRFWYRMYTDIMPRILDVMRNRGKQKTKTSLGGA